MHYENIVVLSAESKDSNNKFPDYKNGMYLGGQVRMEAVACLAKKYPNTEFTVVGGYNELGTGNINSSDKVNDISIFLKNIVPNIKLRLIYSLPCTHHNFVALLNSWKNNAVKPEKVGILTNQYHLPRALAFARLSSNLIYPGLSLQFESIAAEEVLGKTIDMIVGGRYAEYLKRLEHESEGLQKIKTNSYVDYCLTRDFDKLKPIILEHTDALLAQEEKVKLGLD